MQRGEHEYGRRLAPTGSRVNFRIVVLRIVAPISYHFGLTRKTETKLPCLIAESLLMHYDTKGGITLRSACEGEPKSVKNSEWASKFTDGS